jgi:hypothetical protein
MTIIDAITDPHMFGSLFKRLDTWRGWLTLLRAVYGLPMDAADMARFRRHTGRHAPRPGGYPEVACVVGCQSGKTQVAALIGVFEAARAIMQQTRNLYVPLVAQDSRASQRALFGYVKEAVMASPVLAREVVKDLSETLELTGGLTLAVYPCRPAAIRGIRAACVIIDELAFFVSTDGRPTDVEMLRAARSRIATTGGKVIVLSSPYAQAGALWELHRRHYGQEDSSTLIWQASAPDMNPTLPRDYLERMAQDDPEAYRSEVLGEFRAGVSTLFEPEALDACLDREVRERAPLQDRPGKPTPPPYGSFIDAASGSGRDAFTCAVAHAEGDRVVLDCLRAWRPPFNPSGVIREVADLLRTYRLSETAGDRYAPGFVAEGFRAHGISYRPSQHDRSALYLELLPLVNARRAVLLDRPDLLKELRGLERRRGPSGRDRVDHRPGQHDDLANAAAGALVLAAQALDRAPLMLLSGGQWLTGAVQQVRETVGAALASMKSAASSVSATMTPEPEVQCFPTADGHRRSLDAIRALAPGCRSPQEQARLDRHDAQQRQRQTAFERFVMSRPAQIGVFPGDPVDRPRRPFDANPFAHIRALFEHWR